MKVLSLSDIEKQYKAHFSTPPLLVKGCGRINLIGEHTDYNEGLVLPAAIDRHIYFAMAENGTTDCHFVAANLAASYDFSLDNLEPSGLQWADYMIGILKQLKKEDISLEGINLVFGGNLPIGSGMSSSAALECGFALGLCSLFNLSKSRQDLARLCQRSSNEFMGIPSGIMDQFASLMGQTSQFIKLDCRSLSYEYVPMDLGAYEIILVNSGISHDHAGSAYSDRVSECQKGVEVLKQSYPQITSLRDVELYQLGAKRAELGELVYRRCSYVVKENKRVEKASIYLKEGSIEKLGHLLYETHEGLSRDYEVSCPELDFLVAQAQGQQGVAGARVMGGGFGGCTLNLVHQDHKKDFISSIKQAYYDKWSIEADIYEVAVEDGTNLIR